MLVVKLDLLPEVAVAEEARDSSAPGSQAIYESIMRQSVRYSIMGDYALAIRIENPTPGAFLNGNTCVPSMLAKIEAITSHVAPRPEHLETTYSSRRPVPRRRGGHQGIGRSASVSSSRSVAEDE
ncbi:hypothetical protein QBC45DRAFT_396393 [Copromyces sp. CBS 386.78]|nr:hypothetical protein QBC45DRAFT_396393 [Copromyces sp. CBS 386.78]